MSYPTGYDGPPDPHNGVERITLADGRKRATDAWRCMYCGAVGGVELLGSAGCTSVAEDCEHCGCSPVCAEDCPGMVAVFGREGVYVAGLEG